MKKKYSARLISGFIAFGVLWFSLNTCTSSYKGPISDHFDGEKFYHGERDVTTQEVVKWMWSRNPTPWVEWIANKTYDKPIERVTGRNIKATFINHATTLLQLDSLNILTDPIWSERASPSPLVGPKRVRKPGISIENLPPIDLILISHNHYDHLDLSTLKTLVEKFNPKIYVGLGVKKFLNSNNIHNVVEMDWWQKDSTTFNYTNIVFVPARHNSQRGLLDTNETLWGGFVIESSSGPVYFAGDTGYGNFLNDLKERYNKFSLALLPIGAYKPRWFMHTHHMDPEDAVKTHVLLNVEQSLGIHFGTFYNLTDEGIEEPIHDLTESLLENQVDHSRFWVLDFGEGRFIDTSYLQQQQ